MRWGIALLGVIGLGLCLTAAAGAATITADTGLDEFSGPTGSTCALREAIQAANTNADFGGCEREGAGAKDTIRLESGVTYTRSVGETVEDLNESGDLDIASNVVIEVVGQGRAQIDAQDLDRVIDVLPGGKLKASKLVILDGELAATAFSGNHGGGISVSPGATLKLRGSTVFSNEILGPNGSPQGGGIFTGGVTTLTRVLVNQNVATGVGGGVYASSGGPLTISRSTLDQNTSDVGGGGISLGSAGGTTVRIDRSTISRNTSLNDGLGGGGILVSGADSDDFRLTNSTISGNGSAHDGGGILMNSGGLKVNATTITENSAELQQGEGGGVAGGGASYNNTIIADNFKTELVVFFESDCASDVERLHGTNNLVGEESGCPTRGSAAIADPKLKPLNDYGGTTFTHALRQNSPAIGEAGKSSPPRDQRGVKRDAHPDVGAFER